MVVSTRLREARHAERRLGLEMGVEGIGNLFHKFAGTRPAGRISGHGTMFIFTSDALAPFNRAWFEGYCGVQTIEGPHPSSC